jgi:hypothetical protein
MILRAAITRHAPLRHQESKATRRLYGLDAAYGPTRLCAAQSLIARRWGAAGTWSRPNFLSNLSGAMHATRTPKVGPMNRRTP